MDVDKTQKTEPRDTAPEDFYGQPDSCYVKIQFDKEVGAFRFEVRNELFYQYPDPDTVPEELKTLVAFIRGMLEVAIANPHDMYQVGMKAINAEIIASTEGLSDAQKDLLMGEPAGKA